MVSDTGSGAGGHRADLEGDPPLTLLEREDEVGRLDAVLAAASSGLGKALVIEGPPGIGKSALLRVARERARARGLAVLAARGTELEADYAFGVVRQCLVPALRAADAVERSRLLTGAAGLAAPVVLDGFDGASTSYGMLEGLYWLLSNLAERSPMLLVVDDAQWSDEPSLRFLRFLVHRAESLPIAIALALRGGDAYGHELDALYADPTSEVLRPLPLTQRAIDELLRSSGTRRVEEPFSRACLRATGGNPFLLIELLRTLREQDVGFIDESAEGLLALAPTEVTRSVQARLARLAPHARQVAVAIAILGDDVDAELAAGFARLDIVAAADGADLLARAGLFDAGRLLRFRHPLLRAAVLASLSTRDRDRAHRRAVAQLRSRGAAPERVALHILASTPGHGQDDIETLRTAARHACRHGAPESAVPLLRRALEEPGLGGERGDLLLDLGLTELTAGQHRAAGDHLEAAARCAGDPVARGRAVAALATAHRSLRADHWRAIAPMLDAALADLAHLAPGERELTLTLESARLRVPTLVGDLEDPRAASIAERFARLPGDTPAECAALAHLTEYRRLLGAAAPEIGDLAERATRRLDALLEAGMDSPAVYFMFEALKSADRLDAAERVADRGIAIARRQGAVRAFAAAHWHRSFVQSRRGQLRDAEADARTATASPDSDLVWRALAQIVLARCLLDRGDLHGAQQAYIATGIGDHVPEFGPLTRFLFIRMRLRAAQGQPAAALLDFEDGYRRYGAAGTSGPLIGHLLFAVELHQSVGETDAAADLLARALAEARRWGTNAALGQALRTEGRLARGDRAIALFRESCDLLERSQVQLGHARSLVDLGAALRRAGHRVDAREPLRRAHEIARTCGADALAEGARLELAASGVRLRRPALTGADSLTPSERRIVDLAAGDATNAEIAQSLFVTVKTVEMHLTHAFRKLDVTKRTELRGALSAPTGVKTDARRRSPNA